MTAWNGPYVFACNGVTYTCGCRTWQEWQGLWVTRWAIQLGCTLHQDRQP